ncbi:hypothetical protein ACPVPU_11585 [Sphingomonas sp. CJ99]
MLIFTGVIAIIAAGLCWIAERRDRPRRRAMRIAALARPDLQPAE